MAFKLFAILQKYDFSSKSQREKRYSPDTAVVCDTAKVRFFKQITTSLSPVRQNSGCLRYCKSTIFQANHNSYANGWERVGLFAILQKYDFSSKSQQFSQYQLQYNSCLRYCKSTIFQANHNLVVILLSMFLLFAILQKYDFSSKSQLNTCVLPSSKGCLRYCKSTIFQANHNQFLYGDVNPIVVCDTAKVRFFKQITTYSYRQT